MNKLNFIIAFTLFATVYNRQIGLIANRIYTYEPLVNNSYITTITFENTSSCNACICAAFISTMNYIAINCYKENNTCFLFTSLVNITGMIPSQNTSLYILSYTLIPRPTANNSTTSLSTTTTATISSRTTRSASADTTIDITTIVTTLTSSLSIKNSVTTEPAKIITSTSHSTSAITNTFARTVTTTTTTKHCITLFTGQLFCL